MPCCVFFWGGGDGISYGVSEVAASGKLFFSSAHQLEKKKEKKVISDTFGTPQNRKENLTIATEHTLNTPNAIGPRQETESRFAFFRLCNIIV